MLGALSLQDLPAVRVLFYYYCRLFGRCINEQGLVDDMKYFVFQFFDKFYVDLLLGVSLILTAEY